MKENSSQMKEKCRKPAGFTAEFLGSGNWTRTSDIRINSIGQIKKHKIPTHNITHKSTGYVLSSFSNFYKL